MWIWIVRKSKYLSLLKARTCWFQIQANDRLVLLFLINFFLNSLTLKQILIKVITWSQSRILGLRWLGPVYCSHMTPKHVTPAEGSPAVRAYALIPAICCAGMTDDVLILLKCHAVHPESNASFDFHGLKLTSGSAVNFLS